jgi:hypothetical protein
MEELRAYGGGHVQVVRRLAGLISSVVEACPAERRPALGDQLERLRAQVASTNEPLRTDLEEAIAAGLSRP